MNDTTTSNAFPTNVFVAPGPVPPVTLTVNEPWREGTVSRVTATHIIDSTETAEILNVTPNNLRQMVHKKKLTPVGKRGRRTLFDYADVQALAEKRGVRS